MAKGKDGDNRFGRMLKNRELMGKGEVKTQEQHLKDGPRKTTNQVVEEIKAKQAEKDKNKDKDQ